MVCVLILYQAGLSQGFEVGRFIIIMTNSVSGQDDSSAPSRSINTQRKKLANIPPS